jgi:deaminated glutathione amidase
MGAEVILHPSLTGTVDRDVELAIARSTAATNQCYFVDINGLGAGGTGRSIVVGPEGDVLHQAGTGEELIPVELDLERVRRTRERGISRWASPQELPRSEGPVQGLRSRWKGGSEGIPGDPGSPREAR